VSAAAILLTSEAAIAEEPDDGKGGGMPDMSGMGGGMMGM
jgi:chaperonin GroEL